MTKRAMFLTWMFVVVAAAFIGACDDTGNQEQETDTGTEAETQRSVEGETSSESELPCDISSEATFDEGGTYSDPDAWIPEGWTIEHYGTGTAGHTWNWDTAFAPSFHYPNNTESLSGKGYVMCDSFSFTYDFDEWFISPTFERGSCTSITLAFNHFLSVHWKEGDPRRGHGEVAIAVDGGQWQVLQEYGDDASGRVQIDLLAAIGEGRTFRVGFHYTARNDNYWQLDDISIQGER